MCAFLIGRMLLDLDRRKEFPEIPATLPPLFSNGPAAELVLPGVDGKELFSRVAASVRDADTYFACLAALQKARLKYERILSAQPLPTLEQVGPRALLQFGRLTSEALVSLLFWRKWFFDIDNRAGQETGYLFEPVIAYAIGGTPAPASRSPIKRHRDRKKSRQVDCIIDERAYEFKIHVTTAASGQGRWQEELDFPIDCRKSRFKPVLVCMDGTPNPKLEALKAAFLAQDGEVHIGECAWAHLDSLAGETMSAFLERYVRGPIVSLLRHGDKPPRDLTARADTNSIEIAIGSERLRIARDIDSSLAEPKDAMPPDAGDVVPGS